MTIKIGVPETNYSTAKVWEPFMQYIFDDKSAVELVSLDPNYGLWELPKDIDLILFDGGSDVHPILYGGIYSKHLSVDLLRDWMEVIIYNFYKNLGVPMSGICRGSQFLNVMNGGTLYEDLPTEKLGHTKLHDVVVEKCSSFSKYTRLQTGDVIRVNSFHHQAVKILGNNLYPVLSDKKTGVIEGFASKDDKIRAVQSHPEYEEKDYPNRFKICSWLFRKGEW